MLISTFPNPPIRSIVLIYIAIFYIVFYSHSTERKKQSSTSASPFHQQRFERTGFTLFVIYALSSIILRDEKKKRKKKKKKKKEKRREEKMAYRVCKAGSSGKGCSICIQGL